MTMMKSYTDLEQSKRLAEILPIESADMFYIYDRNLNEQYGDLPYVIGYKVMNENVDIPCWSLTALLHVISDVILVGKRGFWHCNSSDGEDYIPSKVTDNPVDTCYELILKLHELKISSKEVLKYALTNLIEYD